MRTLAPITILLAAALGLVPTAQAATSATQPPAPAGMVAIPAGEFAMGSDGPASMPNERPAQRVRVERFWIDEHDVTNAEFRRFVGATGYVTTAEKAVDWEELRKQVPPGTS